MRTIIVPVGMVVEAQQIARECDAHGEGMFVVGLHVEVGSVIPSGDDIRASSKAGVSI